MVARLGEPCTVRDMLIRRAVIVAALATSSCSAGGGGADLVPEFCSSLSKYEELQDRVLLEGAGSALGLANQAAALERALFDMAAQLDADDVRGGFAAWADAKRDVNSFYGRGETQQWRDAMSVAWRRKVEARAAAQAMCASAPAVR